MTKLLGALLMMTALSQTAKGQITLWSDTSTLTSYTGLFNVDINNVPTNCGDGTLTIYYRGDFGASFEYIDLYDEIGKKIGITPTYIDCQTAFKAATYTIQDTMLERWVADGKIEISGDPTAGVNFCGVANNQMFATITLTPKVGGNNAALMAIDSPSVFCAGSQDIWVTVANSGINQITSLKIDWSFGGSSQSQVTLSQTLDTCGGTTPSRMVKLGTKTINSPTTIKVWTSKPNNGNDTLNNNDTIELTLTPAMAGIYTVGGTGADYSTISAAVNAVKAAGVCGPVTFRLDKKTFNERVVIDQEISGTSTTNYVRFVGQGAGNTIIANTGTGTTNWSTILLDKADFIIFDSLTVEANGGTYAATVWLTGGADNNTVSNCNLFSSITSTSSVNNNYVISGSTTSMFTAGTTGSDNVVRNCHIRGGYAGISAYGSGNSSASSYINGNSFYDNDIYKPYNYGFYFQYTGEKELVGNTIDSLRSNFGYGMYNRYCAKDSIAGNVFNSTYYGVYQYYANYTGSSTSDTTYFFNNMVSASGYSGLFTFYNYRTLFYNNSVYSGGTYGAYFGYPYYSSTRNNSIYGNSSYAVYLNTTSTLVPNNFFAYNNYYAPNGNLAYHGGNRADLGAWALAYITQNVGSIEYDPEYNSTTDLHTNSSNLNNSGTALMHIDVDIDGDKRPYAPDLITDIGADEYYLAPYDLDVVSLAPGVVAQNTATTVWGTFKNTGRNAITSDTAYVSWRMGNSGSWNNDTIIIGSLGLGADTTFAFKTQLTVTGTSNFDLCLRIDSGIVGDPDALDEYCDNLCVGSGGTFSIDASGNGDFTTFGAAVASLSGCGIAGPVTFNVANGTYTERVDISQLGGASATNTVTFKGASRDGVILTNQATNTSTWSTILFNGADYVNFENMTIRATGSSYGVCVWLTGGADYNGIRNCNLEMSTTTTSGNFAGIVTSGSTTSFFSTGNNANYNTFSGNRIEGGYYGARFYGQSSSSYNMGNEVSNNTMRHQYYYGIYNYYQGGYTFDGNDMDSFRYAFGGTGIYQWYTAHGNINANRIVAPRYGIYSYYSDYFVTGDTTDISNNMISGITYASANPLYLYYNDDLRLTNNSVWTTHTSTSTTYPLMRMYYCDRAQVKNNSFSRTSNGYVMYHYNTSTLLYAQFENNNFYSTASGNWLYFNAFYSSVSAMETGRAAYTSNNVQADPQHNSYQDLHTTSLNLNNLGQNGTGITTDFDGETRPLAPDVTVDIGADEYYVPPFDLDVVSIDQPSLAAIGNNTVSATFTNNGYDTIRNDTAIINFKANGGSTLNDTIFITQLDPGATLSKTFTGSWSITKDTTYDICVDITNSVRVDPDTDEEFCTSKCLGASGSYSIDANGNGDFMTFGEALDFLYNCAGGVSGKVTFNVAAGTYGEQVVLTPLTGMSATNTVTFKGAGRWSTKISFLGTNTNFPTVKLDGASYFAFEDMTIENTTTFYGTCIMFYNGANRNTIMNCNVDMGTTMTSSQAANICFTGSETSIFTSSATSAGDYNKIMGCRINGGGYYGIRINGRSSSDRTNATEITNNTFRNQYYYPLYLYRTDSTLTMGNDIDSSRITSSYGIYSTYNSRQRIIDNRIVAQRYGLYMLTENPTSTDSSWVYNNMISTVGSVTSQRGVYWSSVDRVTFLHNSVYKAGTSTSSSYPTLYMSGADNNLIKNNTFTAGGGYVLYHASGTIPTGNLDYNNYYGGSGTIYRLDGANYTTFSAMKSGKTNYNQNSINVDPNHSSTRDLHVTGSGLNNKGDKSVGITTDIDGDTRPFAPDTLVDIGADEYIHSDYDADIVAFTSPAVVSLNTGNNISINIRNNGDSTFRDDTVLVQYTINGGTPIKDTAFIQTLAFGNESSFTFGTTWTPTKDTSYEICAKITPSFKSDLDANDELCVSYCVGAADTLIVDKNGGGDYTTISAALGKLNCGVAGPTVIMVKEGIYNESVTLGEKAGMSATNTVRIVGETRSKVIWNPASSSDFATVRIDGGDYYGIENMTVKNMNTNTLAGCVVWMGNSADNNWIADCDLMASTTTTNFNTAVVATSGSATTVYTTGDNAENVVIDGCTISGGYRGISLYSPSTITTSNGLVVSNNTFSDQYYYPVYVYGYENCEYSGNDVQPFRNTFGYAMYIYYNQRTRIFNNTVESKYYGIYNYYNNYNGGASDSSWVYNNSISITNNDFAAYPGIYGYRSDRNMYWHNTIVTTTQSTSTFGSCIYMFDNDNSQVKNNVLVAENNGYLIYRSSGSLPSGSVDYNSYYAPNTLRFYWNTTYTGFSSWRTGASTENANSTDVNPYLVSTTDHHAGALELRGTATPLGITNDFDGDTRSATTPDMGADEIRKDISISAVVTPNNDCRHPNSVDTLTTTILNSGVSRLAPGDTIYVSSRQGGITSTDTLVVPTGSSMAPRQSSDYTMSSDLITGSAGVNNVKVNGVLVGGDININNDTFFHSYQTNPFPLPGFTAADVCEGDSSSYSNGSFITLGKIDSYKWYFGDGDSSMMMAPKHKYSAYDTFTVMLIATSDSGCMDTVVNDVVVDPNPSTSFTTTDVCHHAVASFTNGTSIPHGTLTYAWDMGDNTNTSASTDPTLTYASDGTYSVELVATSDQGCKDSETKNITIMPTPNPAFTASEECETDATSFTNQTTVTSGSYSLDWSFGDGNTSASTNPSNTYANDGSYTAKLVASTTNGCKDSVTNTVTVNPLPVSSFNVVNLCFGDTMRPSNNSTGTIASTKWYFGDGNTSTTTSPSHRYVSSGSYTVSLVVTTNKGCVDSSTATVSVATQPQSAFAASTECEHDAIGFTNQTSVACGVVSNYEWIYGDGKTENFNSATNPTHFYPRAGTYTAKLVITLANGFKDTSVNSVTVLDAPTASFSNNATCEGKVVQFTSSSTNGSGTLSNYSWTFGDGGSSTLRNPTNTYSSSGSYTVNMIAGDNNGCSDTATKSVTVSPNPSAGFSASNKCAGDTVNFTNSSSISSGSNSYMWNFGDNTSSTTASPSKVYSSASFYTVKLVATSNANCKDSTTRTIQAYANPTANFSASDVCDGESMSFNNLSSGAASYAWDFGDNSGTSSATAPSYTYGSDGNYAVELTATTSNGCVDDVTIRVAVDKLPTASFSAADQCDDEQVTFTNNSTGASTYSWTYGDGSGSTLTSPKHTYGQDGKYAVKLTSTSSKGCEDDVTDTVEIYALPTANFSSSDVCDGTGMSFTNSSSGASTYAWDFGDNTGTSSASAPSYTYGNTGTYAVELTATTTNGCEDVVSKNYTVNPNPSSAFSASAVCDGDNMNFTNSSTISSGTMSHSWNFGDNSGTSNNTSPSYKYASANSYSVKLTSTSDKGCTDDVTNSVTVNANPVANFSASNVCLGAGMGFTNSTTGASSYDWDFGDGSNTVSTTSPSHTYTSAGTYTVTLTATSSSGCEHEVTKKVTVYTNPSVSFTAGNVCDGVAMTTTNSTSGASTYAWDFGDGSGSSQSTPSHTYASANNYTVKLVGTSSNGCKDSSTASISVYALPSVGFSASTVCEGLSTAFTNSTTGASSYSWSYGDGSVGNGTNPSYTYGASGSYSVTLTATSSNNCSANATNSVTVNSSPSASFSAANICAEDSMRFSNGSTGGATYWWYFGDGDSSSAMSPVHYYGMEGQYDVRLVATSADGCVDETTIARTVNDKPDASYGFTYQNTAEIDCEDEKYDFSVDSIQSNVVAYEWNFDDGKGATFARSTTQSWATAGDYTISLKLTTVNGCTDMTSSDVTIHANPMASFTSNDTCLQDGIQFTDKSTSADPITHAWNFGDGGISSAASPLYTYTNADGVFSPELTVTTDKGCPDTYSENVSVYPLPVADFAIADVCSGDTSMFLNSSNISAGTLSYDWTLDDGNTSQDDNPAVVYADSGSYNITLDVTSDRGCKATTTVPHEVFASPNAQFVLPPALCQFTAIELPDTFKNAIDQGWTVSYDDGNGNVTDSIPSILYAEIGNYNPSLAITTENGCYDSAAAVIEILEVPKATWTYLRENDKGDIVFTPDTFAGASYAWDFGDGNTSSDSIANNSFTTAGATTVALTVTASNGCQTVETREVDIFNVGVERFGIGHSLAAYPNPFTDKTNVVYNLEKPAYVKMEVFDMNGRSLGVISDGNRMDGRHVFELDSRHFNSASGNLLMRVIVDDQVHNLPLVRLR